MVFFLVVFLAGFLYFPLLRKATFQFAFKVVPFISLFQVFRWVPVLIILAAVGWGYYAYVVELCIKTLDNNIQRVLYLVFFHIVLLLFCASYYRTIFSTLRPPPSIFFLDKECLNELNTCDKDDQSEQAILSRYVLMHRIPVKTRDFSRGIRYCSKCKCIKPDRAHHCSICGHCILKFDHHCPWVNNCVNFYNYKFFLLFLGYGFLFCLFVFFTDLPYFIQFWMRDYQEHSIKASNFHLLFLVLISGMFAISLSCLFSYHLFLTARNRTTVESFRAPMLEEGPDKRAFDHGIRANYREVFGYDPRLWMLPIFSSGGDGSVFPIRQSGVYAFDNRTRNTDTFMSPNTVYLAQVRSNGHKPNDNENLSEGHGKRSNAYLPLSTTTTTTTIPSVSVSEMV
ncbi:DHHC zinc finger domain protein [Dictyocaulus viviparus]|uniref:Palmitoyltransferase n=1 Tax=Dictyocaulus viviparus TaxID=29172 RepID=A0A0D8XUY7_DICVI|nr:DHHC zinc finger domain protein [Dictyocaulus viviparus]